MCQASRPPNRTPPLSGLIVAVTFMSGCLPLCWDDGFLHYFRLQARRVCAALGRDGRSLAGIRVLVQPCMRSSDGAVRVDIWGRSPEGESHASEVDPHAYLAVRGAFDRLLLDWRKGTPTRVPAPAEQRRRSLRRPGRPTRLSLAAASPARGHPVTAKRKRAAQAPIRESSEGGGRE